MKRTIYKELIIIFIAVLLFSNIITGIFVASNFEYKTISDMTDSLISSVEGAKSIYVKYDLSREDLNSLYKDKKIPIKFIDNTNEYNLTNEQLKSISDGEVILINAGVHGLKSIPVAIGKVDNLYIISDIVGHTIFSDVRDIIGTNSTIAIILGSLIFLVVGKMTIKPIKEITDATKKVATGDFEVKLINNRCDELGELIDSFNKMTTDLKSIEILRNDFISDISHEFKTPITSIEGYTKLLINSNDDERKEYIDIILQETKRLTLLATNILTLNKIDHEKINDKEEFSLDEQIRKSILLLENKWNTKNLELELDLEEVWFKGNKGLINQVWINLIDNAIKFSHENGVIAISLKNLENNYKFIIKDNGPGINEVELKRIFDKFYKGDTSRSSEGAGLGLSIVKRIVDLHDGSIDIDSEIGSGTSISISLKKDI